MNVIVPQPKLIIPQFEVSEAVFVVHPVSEMRIGQPFFPRSIGAYIVI